MTNYFPKILITGGQGQLACALKEMSHLYSFNIMCCDRNRMDICDMKSIQAILLQFKPDVIVNTAAYTAVDLAEKHYDQAMQVNYMAVKNLSVLCRKHSIPLIHLSTDYVFDGKQTRAFTEQDQINPLNTYGLSKSLGEAALREEYDKHVILRISGLFSIYRNNFVKTILQLHQQHKTLRIVSDQITCPTYASEVAKAIFAIINNFNCYGTYHFCSHTPISWYDLTQVISQEISNSPVTILPIHSNEYLTSAKRPAYSVLNCEKIRSDYSILQPDWREGVKTVISSLLNNQEKNNV